MHCLTDHYFMYILIHLIQDFEKDFSSFQENVADCLDDCPVFCALPFKIVQDWNQFSK